MSKTVVKDTLDKVEKVHEWFLKRQQKLAFAESCTGGLLSSWITQWPGSSNYFLGSVISYSGFAKAHFLGVPKSLMQVVGQVSEPVARAMAHGVKKELKSDWSVSITGIAGPTGGTKEKPVGTVSFAVVGPGYEKTITKVFESRERTQIQWMAAEHAVELLLEGIGTE